MRNAKISIETGDRCFERSVQMGGFNGAGDSGRKTKLEDKIASFDANHLWKYLEGSINHLYVPNDGILFWSFRFFPSLSRGLYSRDDEQIFVKHQSDGIVCVQRDRFANIRHESCRRETLKRTTREKFDSVPIDRGDLPFSETFVHQFHFLSTFEHGPSSMLFATFTEIWSKRDCMTSFLSLSVIYRSLLDDISLDGLVLAWCPVCKLLIPLCAMSYRPDHLRMRKTNERARVREMRSWRCCVRSPTPCGPPRCRAADANWAENPSGSCSMRRFLLISEKVSKVSLKEIDLFSYLFEEEKRRQNIYTRTIVHQSSSCFDRYCRSRANISFFIESGTRAKEEEWSQTDWWELTLTAPFWSDFLNKLIYCNILQTFLFHNV